MALIAQRLGTMTRRVSPDMVHAANSIKKHSAEQSVVLRAMLPATRFQPVRAMAWTDCHHMQKPCAKFF